MVGAVAATLAATTGAGALDASAATTTVNRCKFPSSSISWRADSTLTGRGLKALQDQAVWTTATTNVKLRQLPPNADANIKVGVRDLQASPLKRPAAEVGSTVVWCAAEGGAWARGPEIYIDREFLATAPTDVAVSAVIGHELGHALGLMHYNALSMLQFCPNMGNRFRPISLMGSITTDRGQVCGPTVLSEQPDRDALNSLYK